MIKLPLNMNTRLGCNCAPGKVGCPYCAGFPGALPHLNRDALEKAVDLLAAMGAQPVSRAEAAYLPDASSPKGYRLCTASLAVSGGAYLAEGEEGEALLVLADAACAGKAGVIPIGLEPGDALMNIASACIAMDLPPINLNR